MITSARSLSVAVASWVLTVVGALIALSAAFIVFVPIDATNFAAETGLDWARFTAANPEAGSYLVREARVLAVGYLSLGLVAATLAWRPLRAGKGWALVALSIFAGGLLATSAVFVAAGDTVVGATYATAAVVSGIALTFAARSLAEEDSTSED